MVPVGVCRLPVTVMVVVEEEQKGGEPCLPGRSGCSRLCLPFMLIRSRAAVSFLGVSILTHEFRLTPATCGRVLQRSRTARR